MTVLSLRQLNRTTLHRQRLLERETGSVTQSVAGLAGLQAQHATWPYVALWTRRDTPDTSALEAALTKRSVVKATSMRTALHIVASTDALLFDRMSAPPRLTTWQPSAKRACLDLLELNIETRAFCREPRSVAEIEAHLAGLHPNVDPSRHIPQGVSHAWFRLAAAGGGLVHASPSGYFRTHGQPRYVDIDEWLTDVPAAPAVVSDDAQGDLATGLVRFLAAYGPATVADMMQWSGVRRIGLMR